MGWVQGPMLKMKPYGHPDDPDEWFAVVKVTPNGAFIEGYYATNPLERIKELENQQSQP